jgi:thioredoxin 1
MRSYDITHASDATFQAEVLESDVPVLVDFWADWCAPCLAVAPLLDRIAKRYAGRAKVVKVDVDANRATPARYGVRGIPTLLVFKSGEVVGQLVGNPGSEQPLDRLVADHV